MNIILDITSKIVTATDRMVPALIKGQGSAASFNVSAVTANDRPFVNASSHGETHTRHYWALVLLIIPALTLFGNLLVICSVVRYRNLHSAINYFILGLALADLMVALAVMPFAVYVEFNNGVWELTEFMCDLYCSADVTCSTASIFLLTIISFDRYMAATQPIKYLNSNKGVIQVALINLVVWFVSMLIASPMVLGLNNVPERNNGECRFYNADFIIYSSTGSFCIPLGFMFYLYARIYKVIRQRGKMGKERSKSQQTGGGSKRPSRDPVSQYNQLANQKASSRDTNPPVSPEHPNQTLHKSRSHNTVALLSPDHATVSKCFDSGHPPSDDEDQQQQLQQHLPLLIEAANHICYHTVKSADNVLALATGERCDDEEEDFKRHCIVFVNKSRRNTGATTQLYVDEPGLRNLKPLTAVRRWSSWQPHASDAETLEHFAQSMDNVDGLVDKGVSQESTNSNEDSPDSSSESEDAAVLTDVSTFYANVGAMVLTKIQQRQQQMVENGNIAARKTSRKNSRQPSMSNLLHKRKISRKVLKSAKKEKKATKTLAIVLGVFLICWLPFFTLNLINAICLKMATTSCRVGFLPFFLTTWLGYMNSAMNPVIYTVFNLEFRRAFKQCLCPWFNKSNRQPRRV